MWKRFFFLCALSLAVVSLLIAEQAEQWYLITESELRSIEEYKRNSEAERLSWQSQAGGLRMRAERLNGRAESLLEESENSNRQLREERELRQRLTQSFNEYETGQSRLMSQKDTRIVHLETENKGKETVIVRRIIAASALALAWAGFIALRVCRFLKIVPI
jgi:hypothetical protein